MSTKRPWSEHLLVVSPAQGDKPKSVTVAYPYYDNPGFLARQLAWWATFDAALRQHVTAIIVDDGSPLPAADVLRAEKTLPFPIRLFRIEQDVRWNWLAARNIAFHHASNGWVAVTDMDHIIPASTLSSLVYGKHDPNTIYGFSRIEGTGEVIGPHPNSWFLTREMFWTVGGYDETMSGFYGSDGDWRRRLAATAPMAILEDRLVRHEHVGDSSTTSYLRKQPEDARIKQIVAARRPGWKAKTLSFQYHEETLELARLVGA